MSESSVDSEHSDWTMLQADNADPPLQSQVDNEDEDNEKGISATAVDEEVSTAESSDIECLSPNHMDADGEDVDARSDITASIHSHSSNFIHLNPDELLEAEVQSQASADSISVIADEHEHDLHVDLSNLSSFSSINNELPTDLSVTRHRAYTHVPNRKLNITLNLVLALSFTMVVGLGLGHFLGWSTKWEQTVATIQTMKVQELHDDLIECMSRPVAQDEHDDNLCNRELPQDFESTETCQIAGDSGVDEELLQEFNELKNNLDARQRELTAALENIEQAQMKERSSLDRLRQLEEENQELKSLVDEEMANDQMENQIADKLKMENVQLKEDLARLRQELEAEIASDQQFGEPNMANQADAGGFREQMNQLEVENEDLRRVIAKLRYVDHPNMMTDAKEAETAVPVDTGTPDSEETPLSEWLRTDHLSSVIENVMQLAKHKFDADGNGHVSLAEALNAYKSVFDQMVSMSASLNSEQILGMVQTTLKDSVGKMEKMGLDITGRWSQKPDTPHAIMQQVSQMADKLAELLVARKQEENVNQEGGNAQVNAESIEDKEPKKNDDSIIAEDGLKDEKQNMMSQGEENNKLPKEQSDKISKVKGKNDRASKNTENKMAKGKNRNKISTEKNPQDKDGIKISKEKGKESKLSKTNENKVLKEKERNKELKEKEIKKVQPDEKKKNKVPPNEKDNNKISKEKERHKESKEKKNDKVPKGKENNKVSKGKENSKRAEDNEDKIDKKQTEVVSEKATKTSKDSGKRKESNSKTSTKDEKRQTKIRDDDNNRDSKKVRDKSDKNKKNKKNSSNKKSENSTDSSAGMWMFERANQRESSRNKGHEADWYFERKHREHKESRSKLYVKQKNKYDHDDDDDDEDDEDDEGMKYSKTNKKDKKSHKDKRYCKTQDDKKDAEDDDNGHHMKWHSKLAKNFQKYKKNIKGYWTSFQQNWQTAYNQQAKAPHHSSYFGNFHKSH